MADSVLCFAEQIYTPFRPQETERLQTYRSDVEELVGSRYFTQRVPQNVTISGGGDQPVAIKEELPEEEAIRAIVPLFRQLFIESEPTSYLGLMKLLSEHAATHTDSPLKATAISDLRDLRRWHAEVLRAQPIGFVIQRGPAVEERLTNKKLIDLYLHGYYLHKRNAKSAQLASWPVPPLRRHMFLSLIEQLTQVYWVGRNMVAEVLKVPALLNVP